LHSHVFIGIGESLSFMFGGQQLRATTGEVRAAFIAYVVVLRVASDP
jgi:hypothetical protein